MIDMTRFLDERDPVFNQVVQSLESFAYEEEKRIFSNILDRVDIYFKEFSDAYPHINIEDSVVKMRDVAKKAAEIMTIKHLEFILCLNKECLRLVQEVGKYN